MTPEEQAAWEEYFAQMQQGINGGYMTVGNAVNDYGQGSYVLPMEDRPESFNRAIDMQNQIEDVLKLSGLRLEDVIPGLPQVVEKPTGERYVNYEAQLFAGNPAYEAVREMMAKGVPFDKAVRDVAADKEFQPYLPTNERNMPDPQGFRTSAQSYVTGKAEEDATNSVYDEQQAAYDLYVNGTDKLTEQFGGLEGLQSKLTGLRKKEGLPRGRGSKEEPARPTAYRGSAPKPREDAAYQRYTAGGKYGPEGTNAMFNEALDREINKLAVQLQKRRTKPLQQVRNEMLTDAARQMRLGGY